MPAPQAAPDYPAPTQDANYSQETADSILTPAVPLDLSGHNRFEVRPSMPELESGKSDRFDQDRFDGVQIDCPSEPGYATQPAISRFELATKLQEQGATHYRLEKWGDAGQLYRFQCEVAINGRPGFRQHFEAVAPTDREAMRRVLAEVTANR